MTVETVQISPVENPVYSVVVPVRDRYGAMLRNCLRSIELQTLESLELIIVDYGSTKENHEKLLEMLPDCTVYRYETTEPWSLAAARNIGLRRARAPISCAFDADLIMDPSVLEYAHRIHKSTPNSYLTTRVILLDEGSVDPDLLELPRDYGKLLTAKSAYLSEGWGGFTSAMTSWWHRCRGFDERMTVWGWEDVDMWKRAARAGMRRLRLSDEIIWETAIYHQPHGNIQLEAITKDDSETLRTIKRNEHLAKQSIGIERNDEHWGHM
ncbi:glycosyltransferase [Patescibacteria group bacterium]|nr:glycosyltransferase [Patescibacteria group bacterium]